MKIVHGMRYKTKPMTGRVGYSIKIGIADIAEEASFTTAIAKYILFRIEQMTKNHATAHMYDMIESQYL